MCKHRTFVLTDEQRSQLQHLRDHANKPYLRERAAALLKVDAGQYAAHVARSGLLKPHNEDTVYEWLDRYQAEGIAGLYVRSGRGRKPAYHPFRRRSGTGQRSSASTGTPGTGGR